LTYDKRFNTCLNTEFTTKTDRVWFA